MKKFIILLITTLFTFSLFSCRRPPKIPEGTMWQKFEYKEYGGYLYVAHYNEKVHGYLCFDYVGLQGHAILEHECTPEQFKDIPDLLIKNLEAVYVETTDNLDLTNYPDLSMYLSFVMSSDELHEIWANLNLEEHLYQD